MSEVPHPLCVAPPLTTTATQPIALSVSNRENISLKENLCVDVNVAA